MKKSLLKHILFFLVAPAILFAFTSKPDPVNFSGDWKLNADKSDLGQFAEWATRTIKADQKADAISISRTAPSFEGGDRTTVEVVTFDGKEVETTLWGNSKKKSAAKWSEDGQALTTKYTLYLDFNGQMTEITGTEVWTLTDGGKTLVAQNNSSSSFGDLATKSVYEKQ